MNPDDNDANQVRYYVKRAEELKQDEGQTMCVDYKHLASFDWGEEDRFMDRLLLDYALYEPYLKQGLTLFLAEQGLIFTNQKWFQIGIYNLPQIDKIRDLKTLSIGKIMSIKGTVTRTTEIKPELQLGSFKCLACDNHNPGIEQEFKYTKPTKCANEKCSNNVDFELINNQSVFMDWQKVRLQELSSDIPPGSMPRSIDVILRGDTVDQAKPGDKSVFSGVLVAVPDVVQLMKPGEKQQSAATDQSKMTRNDQQGKTMEGFSGLGRTGVKDLSFKMVFIAGAVMSSDSRFGFTGGSNQEAEDEDKEENLNQFSRSEQTTVVQMKDTPDLYTKLAQSIAPSVYGHLDVKKGILL